MNELETQNLHDYTIRKSVITLLLKGGFAWFLLALMDYGFDRLPAVLQGTTLSNNVNLENLSAGQPTFHLILNVLFGWLMLYVVLAWVFEFYIIKNDSIIVRNGIIFSREDVYQMEDIKTINVYQGFWGKIFNTGTVSFYAFRAQKHVYLSGVDKPNAVAAHIYEIHPGPESMVLIPQDNKHNNNHKN